MKRIISLSTALILALLLCFSASANTTGNNTVTVDNYTIIFNEASTLTQDEMLRIAQARVNYNPEENSETSTYGVMCNLFGHKTTTETISVIEHCVQEAQPRCLQTYEDLTVCSRCDYVEVDVLSSVHIFCCD